MNAKTWVTPGEWLLPFTIQVDSAEQLPYSFFGLKTNADKGGKTIAVPIVVAPVDIPGSRYKGDYCIEGRRDIIIERKSYEDFFSTILDDYKTKAFRDKLAVLSSVCRVAFVVVEAERSFIHTNQHSFSNASPKAMMRRVNGYNIDFPNIHFHFCPGRNYTEQLTFRLLEKFHERNPVPDEYAVVKPKVSRRKKRK